MSTPLLLTGNAIRLPWVCWRCISRQWNQMQWRSEVELETAAPKASMVISTASKGSTSALQLEGGCQPVEQVLISCGQRNCLLGCRGACTWHLHPTLIGWRVHPLYVQVYKPGGPPLRLATRGRRIANRLMP